jgi:hypothetical protein
MAISRTRSAGAKVTDAEYRQLEALAQSRGLTLGEWCRETLLARLDQPPVTVVEETILTELVGLRMIVINLLKVLGSGGKLQQEELERIVRRADMEKVPTAVERLREAAGRRNQTSR